MPGSTRTSPRKADIGARLQYYLADEAENRQRALRNHAAGTVTAEPSYG